MAWKDKDKLIKVPDLELPSVSIIIAFRNEENHLPTLLSSFSHLNYPAELFEFIFVDDHSEDNSSGIVSSWLVMNAGI